MLSSERTPHDDEAVSVTTETRICSCAPDGSRQKDGQIDLSRNMTLTFDFSPVDSGFNACSC
jgi:hypothetical protein